MKNVLLYGLQRSGTNYLEQLLQSNYHITLLNSNKDRKHPLQKHFRLYSQKKYISHPDYFNNLQIPTFKDFLLSTGIKKQISGIIILTKDPYSWFISYTNWAHKCDWPESNYHYAHEYNNFYGVWAEFANSDPRIQFLKYYDLLINPLEQLNLLERNFGLKPKYLRKIFGHKTKFRRVAQTKNFSGSRLDYYKQKQYLQQIEQIDLQKINAIVDPSLMDFLGYAFQNEHNQVD